MNKLSTCIISGRILKDDFLSHVEQFSDEVVIVFNDNLPEAYLKEIKLIDKPKFKISTCEFQNFAQMRNQSIKLSSNEWIFVLDDDERLSPELQSNLRVFIEKPINDAYKIKRTHFMSDPPPQEDYWKHIRLFKRYCSYFGKVHETLTGYKSLGEVSCEDCMILHYNNRADEFKKGLTYLTKIKDALEKETKLHDDSSDIIRYLKFKEWTQAHVYLKELDRNLSAEQRAELYSQYEIKKEAISDVYKKIIAGRII